MPNPNNRRRLAQAMITNQDPPPMTAEEELAAYKAWPHLMSSPPAQPMIQQAPPQGPSILASLGIAPSANAAQGGLGSRLSGLLGDWAINMMEKVDPLEGLPPDQLLKKLSRRQR